MRHASRAEAVALLLAVCGCRGSSSDACDGGACVPTEAAPVAAGRLDASRDAGADAAGELLLGSISPDSLVTDGVTLFWMEGARLASLPVDGGTTNLGATVGAGSVLAVDAVNLYVLALGVLYAVPKMGSAGNPLSEPSDGSTYVVAATTLGATAYWAEIPPLPGKSRSIPYGITVRSTPVLGGEVSLVGSVGAYVGGTAIGVTSSAVFVSTPLTAAAESLASPRGSSTRDRPTPRAPSAKSWATLC